MVLRASVKKRERRDRAYFTVGWSPLYPVSRYEIIASVPSMPGIWEIYWLEKSRKPRILKLGAAWHGGLRHSIREQTDPTLPAGMPLRAYLESGDCYYRFTIVESRLDLADLYSVVLSRRPVQQAAAKPTGRYREVRFSEPDEVVVYRRRLPHEKADPPELFGNTVPNMFDVVRELIRLGHIAPPETPTERRITDNRDDKST